jgi:hypothetical protein
VNAIIGLGEEIEESVIIQNVLRSLPMIFDPKISTLEERSDLNSISLDGLHGIFTSYRNINNFESHTQKGYPRRPSETRRISYNMFESLSTEVECYKCNKFGHMAKY